MTKVKLLHVGWAYIVLVLDWHTKKIVGHSIALRSKTDDWLEALNNACNHQFPLGIRDYSRVSLVSDNGCQPTSLRYMQACNQLGIKQILTSFCNPKGNADTERMIRTMKEELIGSNEPMGYNPLKQTLNAWINDYNQNYCYLSIGYIPPDVFEKQALSNQLCAPFIVA